MNQNSCAATAKLEGLQPGSIAASRRGNRVSTFGTTISDWILLGAASAAGEPRRFHLSLLFSSPGNLSQQIPWGKQGLANFVDSRGVGEWLRSRRHILDIASRPRSERRDIYVASILRLSIIMEVS
jgi:hypothetical protein